MTEESRTETKESRAKRTHEDENQLTKTYYISKKTSTNLENMTPNQSQINPKLLKIRSETDVEDAPEKIPEK